MNHETTTAVPAEDGWARRRRRIADRIERAAIELLVERGDENLTVAQIAAAAGISVRTFFRYFATRDDVLTALPRRLNDTTCRRVAARPAQESVLDAFIAAVHEGMDDNDQDLIRLWGRAVQRGFQPVSTSDDGMVDAYAEVIGARLGVPPDDLAARVLATAIASVMWSTFLLWLHAGTQEPLPKFMERAFDVLTDLNRQTGISRPQRS